MSRTLLGIWAHPDDEAYLSAGLMAEFRRRGDRVVVVTATLGEHGTDDPERWPPAQLGARRHIELRNSLAALDVDELRLLGYEDGFCDRHNGTGVIAGRILDEFGDPMTGAQIVPMRYMFINGERRMQRLGGGGATNDLGEYRIHGLSPGRYFVSVSFSSYRSGDRNDQVAYAPTYYAGTGNVAEAQRLTIAAGQTIPAINMTLLPVVAVRVSGVALDGVGRERACDDREERLLAAESVGDREQMPQSMSELAIAS